MSVQQILSCHVSKHCYFFFFLQLKVQKFGMKCSDFWVNYPFKFRPTGCGGTSIGEEISGRYNLRLLFRDVRPNEEEEAAASEWPLTRLIIFLAAAQTKRNNLRMNPLQTEFKNVHYQIESLRFCDEC